MFCFIEWIFLPLFLLFGLPIALALFAFWIWMLVSAIQNKGISDGEKIAWVIAIVFLHFIGALIYLIIGHPKRHTPLMGA
jgi:Phospholipase_D-nuclease N-terminal